MKAYRYDSESKKYIGEVECQIDPLETAASGETVYLLPGNSTYETPLEPKENYDVVWNGSAWEYQEIPLPPTPPEPTEDEKKEMVRGVRDNYLVNWDFSQLRDAPFIEEEKNVLAEYRQYLRDYTKTENWWEQNPATYEEWLVSHHPVVE